MVRVNMIATRRHLAATASRILSQFLAALPPADVHTLTPIHAAFAHATVTGKAYHRSGQACTLMLNVEDAKEWGTTVTDVLLYHYYGGMIAPQLGHCREPVAECESCACLHSHLHWHLPLPPTLSLPLVSVAADAAQCLAVPGTGVSAITVEAYRKWLLGNLLATGKTAPLPPGIPKSTAATLHALARPYELLSKAFSHGWVVDSRRRGAGGCFGVSHPFASTCRAGLTP